ncbi:hypothetical protein [Streptomyces hokutonensis]|uniref:hypothetical protein n=1 Tax=Streptomyces hokutonensis TaxID=1306990 RepID=UPI0033C55F22
MRISQAHADDTAGLARLLWPDTRGEEPEQPSVDAFAAELAQWWSAHRDSHLAFVARLLGPEIVGMAWVALVPRVPRPGATSRLSADIQYERLGFASSRRLLSRPPDQGPPAH